MAEDRLPICVEVKVHGIVVPAWLVVCLLLLSVLASFSLLLLYRSIDQHTRETRILQLHVQDIESVMIQNGHARRADFAPWPGQGNVNQPQPEPQPDSK